MRSSRAALGLVIALLTLSMAACQNSQGGFSGAVGNTPPTKPESSFRVLGNPGTAFIATVSDSRSSWIVQGVIPMDIVIVNNLPPARMVATKLANDQSLMSLNILNGVRITGLASTTAPFGTASVEFGKLIEIAPPASPDVRVNVNGPATELFRGLVEDQTTGFEVQDRAPAVFLFDSPDGSVDAVFDQLQNFGSFKVNLSFNGDVVARVSGGPNVSIKQP